jgi:hypothetical protein
MRWGRKKYKKRIAKDAGAGCDEGKERRKKEAQC